MCHEFQTGSDPRSKVAARARPSSPSSTALPTQMSLDASQGTPQSSCLNLHGSTGQAAMGTSASLGHFCGPVAGRAKAPSWVQSASFWRLGGSSKPGRVGGTGVGYMHSPITPLMSPTSTKNRQPTWHRISGSNGAKCSRYAEQVGRYAEQWRKSLLHIQTKLVAMRCSQPLIHIPYWSLCAHLSRYLPSGAACALGVMGSPGHRYREAHSWT
ncbi:hypothetical protein M2421_003862 [Stenotrophomonas sp. BIGb0135]|nr:hypothetical protein [Stenotrophomonas sp. BIGb0135]